MIGCAVIRDKDTNEIKRVLAPNGEDSILYNQIIGDQSLSKEEALRIWAKAYTPSFQDKFGNWELLADAVQKADTISDPIYKQMFENSPEEFLYMIAQQANSSISERNGAFNVAGEQIFDAAMKLFPEAQPGEPYESRFDEKLDKNYEPRSQYIQQSSETEDPLFNRQSENYKKVLSPQNQKVFEDLIGQGLITAKRWNGMYFVPKASLETTVGRPYRDYRDNYYVTQPKLFNELKAIIDRKQIGWLEVEPSDSGNSYIVKIVPDRQVYTQQKLFKAAGNDVFTKIAERLSKRLGIKYKLIDAEEAMRITQGSRIPWNGEGAFAYKDTVYVLKDAATLDNAIHEFAHFFVKAVHLQSPYLVNKLYNEFKNDPYAKGRYVDFVEEMYKDFDPDQRKEEALVRAITDSALDLVDPKTGNVIIDAIKRIFRTLKNIIRDLFGVRVDNLDHNTTVEQLAAILLGENEGEVINLGDKNKGFFQDMFPLFNRELADELEKLSTSSIKTSINSFYSVISEHLNRLYEDRDLNALREILRNDREGNLLKDEKEILSIAKDLATTLEDKMPVERAALNAFSDSIEGLETVSNRMRKHLEEVNADKEMSNKDKLGVFRKYSFMAREWLYLMNQFTEAVNESSIRGRNPLTDIIRNIKDNFDFMDKEIVKFYQKDGLIKAFREEIESNQYYQAAIKEKKERVALLQKEYDNGKKLLGSKLAKEKELLRRYELTDENVGKYLAGEMGDTNYYSMYLESYTSNPDPIVGTFTNWFLKNKFKAQVKAQARLSGLENRVSKLYKSLGYKPSDFQRVAQDVIHKDKIFWKFDDKGNPQSREVWKLIDNYGNGWDYEYNTLKQEVERERQQLGLPIGDYERYRRKAQQLEQFKLDYMFDDQSEKVKESRLFWYRDATTMKAREEMNNLLDQIRLNSYQDLTKDESLEKKDQNKDLWRQYRQLGSLRDVNGNMKDGEDLEIAKAIQEYREKFGDLYENQEVKGMFEANLKSFQNETIDNLMATGKFESPEDAAKSPEYKNAINNWYSENMRVLLTEDFYKARKAISDRIQAITNKLDRESDRKKLDISDIWNQIIDIVKGYRDEDNQPIGTDLSDDQIKNIKAMQERIEHIKDTFNSMNGLTQEEAERYYGYVNDLQMGVPLDPESYKDYQDLDKKSRLRLSAEDKLELGKAFDDLKALQSKIATPYYTDMVNDFLAKSGSKLRITPFKAEDILRPEVIDKILKDNPEFSKWWHKNHMRKEIWDNKAQNTAERYERLYVWNRIVPSDATLKTLMENNDYVGLMNYGSPYVKVLKSQEYYYKRLKPEYRNTQGKETLWVTHDNKGNWLPKPTAESATDAQKQYMKDHGIPFATDPKFVNQKYMELKNASDQRKFNLLNTFKDFHLETQENLPWYARLGLELPRLRRNTIERTNPEELLDKPKEYFDNIKNWLGSVFLKRNDDFELGSGNYDAAQHTRAYVMTDLMGNKINSIPIKYMSHIDADDVSMDVGKALSMYAISAETNKVLHDINPVANALKEVLQKNPAKDISTQSRSIIDIVTGALRNLVSPHANKSGGYNRMKIINNFLDRELYGIQNLQQFGPQGEKFVNFLMKIGAWGSLGLNMFAAIKNDAAGQLQNSLEMITGRNFTPSDFAGANVDFRNLMSSLMNDYYKLGNKSLLTQLYLMFDPQNNYAVHAGTNFSKSALKDALDWRFVMAMQKFGEINIQGTAWLAMMRNQTVLLSDPQTGEQKQIRYRDAWELGSDNVLKLKDGVDKKWDKDGEHFLQFASRLHKVNELNQGAYSPESQPELHRMTLGKLFLFMRKFYIPGAVNRFSPERYNAALGDFREGYWMPLMDLIGTGAKSLIKGHLPTSEEVSLLYTKEQRMAMLRAMSELGFVGMCALLIRMLGFDGDDKDRYKKLAENSWFHNFLIYQIMMIKSEGETFLPFPGMGVNETVRFLGTPTIAFTTARRWVKLGQDFLYWVVGDQNKGWYQRDSGIYSQGDIKWIADMMNIVGWRNFAYTSSNHDIIQGLRMYSALQNRI